MKFDKKTIFKSKKPKTMDVNGYIIDENTKELLDVPANLSIYKIPSIVKSVSFSSIRKMEQTATEIDFSENENITELPEGAFPIFLGFTKLKKIAYPPNLKKMRLYLDTSILDKGIEIILPKHLEQFSRNQFTPSMTRLELQDSITDIHAGIVTHNNILKELVVTGSVKKLNPNAINQAKALQKLWLKEGIEEIADTAIIGCNNLTEIHIPSSLKYFKLGGDDIRRMKGYTFDGKDYHPTAEQIEEEKQRTLKLYKRVNGREILFEVKRKDFQALLETSDEFIFYKHFQHNDDELASNYAYRVSKKAIGNHEHFIVNVTDKKIYIQDEDNKDGKPIEDFQFQDTFTDLNNIHITGTRKNQEDSEDKVSKIEKLLKLKLSATKKVKNPTTGNFDTISKSRSEIENEMVYIIEELDDYYDEGKLDNKSYHEYLKDIRQVYQQFIANAPIETKTDSSFQPQQPISSQKENYEQLLEQFIGSLLIPEDITTIKNDRSNPNRRNK